MSVNEQNNSQQKGRPTRTNPVGEVCKHLHEGSTGQYVRQFTGNHKEYNLICAKCLQYVDKFKLDLHEVTPEQFIQLEETGEFADFIGVPGIVDSRADLRFEYTAHIIPALLENIVIAMQPIPDMPGSQWVLLDNFGNLQILDLDNVTLILAAHLDQNLINLSGDLKLYVSSRADYAVVTSRSRMMQDSEEWNKGIVVDLHSGETTMTLDRGNYYTTLTDFPIAFFEHENRTLLVHATDWNRLDVSDPATGERLTIRDFESRPKEAWRFNQENGTEFNGNLLISPDNKRLVDDGWIWAPLGNISTFRLDRWLDENVWEADNGPSRLNLLQRSYFWGGPICWIDNDTLCVWGYGDDDENIVPAAILIDINTGKQVDWIAGPTRGLFVYDEHLFTTDEEGYCSVWDLTSGHRLLHEKEFSPQVYHPGTKQFLQYQGAGQMLTAQLVSSTPGKTIQ